MADELADPRPGHPAEVEQRDAPMPEVVRAERWHAGRGAGALNRGAEAVAAEALEDRPLGDAIFARHQRRDGPEEQVRDWHPAGPPSLRYGAGDAPALELTALMLALSCVKSYV
jgi:hypothetical protein